MLVDMFSKTCTSIVLIFYRRKDGQKKTSLEAKGQAVSAASAKVVREYDGNLGAENSN